MQDLPKTQVKYDPLSSSQLLQVHARRSVLGLAVERESLLARPQLAEGQFSPGSREACGELSRTHQEV